MKLNQIGVIHSPYKQKNKAPKQGKFASDISTIEVFEEYQEALDGVESLTHLIVLYWADKADRNALTTTPPWTSETYGIFATRSPNRPNPISFCVAEVVKVEGKTIKAKYLDALDQSPLLDLKAYTPKVDSYPNAHRNDEHFQIDPK